jgi:hypothetical protein
MSPHLQVGNGRRPAPPDGRPETGSSVCAANHSRRMVIARLLVLLAGLAACSGEGRPRQPGRVRSDSAPSSISAPVQWTELAHLDHQRSSVLPTRFRSSTSELRVITRMGPTASPVSPGLIITNLLSESSALPLASVRAEQRRIDTVSVDTTEVAVPPGDLYLFIAQQRGLSSWAVTVQERRPAPE